MAQHLSRADLPRLFDLLAADGHTLVGPTVREGAIVFDEITSVDDLPRGLTDHQEGGSYRLKRRDDEALFGYAVGPHSWKKYLWPSRLRLWRAQRVGESFEVETDDLEPKSLAFIAARSCDLSAILVQDRVLSSDPHYRAQRERVFIVAVQCGTASGTCFCVSMNCGPRATSAFDLALTEVIDAQQHYFRVEIGSDRGRDVVERLDALRPAAAEEEAAADAVIERTAQSMGRAMDTTDIKQLLYQNLEHTRWDDVAARCLSCGNCTQVCPTCFCSTVEDHTDLTNDTAERWRRWDSCFTQDFTYVHGGSVRTTTRSRYRQWMTHKLATWIDQFGTSGCVGCGRCITWCPVGIDITAEVKAFQAEGRDSTSAHQTSAKPSGEGSPS